MTPAAAPAPAAGRQVAIIDLLDRLLQSGAVVHGDVVLSAADIDLVRLDLRLLLAAVDTIDPPGSRRPATAGTDTETRPVPEHQSPASPGLFGSTTGRQTAPSSRSRALGPAHDRSTVPDLTGRSARRPDPPRTSGDELPRRISADPEGAEKGLAQLVLTIVELLRQLMERQALHRVDAGSLTEEEVERLGATFQALAQRMEELKTVFGLDDDDLNLNLGPLGDLL